MGGWSPDEYATAVARIGAHPAVVAIELNVSCPNVESGCISIGTDPGETRALVERCRDETDVPVLAKLSPSVTEIEAIATAAAEGGAHGLVLINTVRGIAIDRATLRPLLGGGGGGLSGPAVKPVALHAVYHAHAATGLPIIGMGGVAGAQMSVNSWPRGPRWSGSGPPSSATRASSAERRPSSSWTSSGEGRADPATWWRSLTHPPQPQVELERRGAEFRLFRRFFSGCTPSGPWV